MVSRSECYINKMTLRAEIESNNIDLMLDGTKVARVVRCIKGDTEKCDVVLEDGRVYNYEICFPHNFAVFTEDYELDKNLHRDLHENIRELFNLENAKEIKYYSNNGMAIETKRCIGVSDSRIARYFRDSKKPVLLMGTKKYGRMLGDQHELV